MLYEYSASATLIIILLQWPTSYLFDLLHTSTTSASASLIHDILYSSYMYICTSNEST